MMFQPPRCVWKWKWWSTMKFGILSDPSMFICSLSSFTCCFPSNLLASASTKLCSVTTHLGLCIRRQSTEGSSCQSGNFHHSAASMVTPVDVDVAWSENLGGSPKKIQWLLIMFSLRLEMWQIQPALRASTMWKWRRSDFAGWWAKLNRHRA